MLLTPHVCVPHHLGALAEYPKAIEQGRCSLNFSIAAPEFGAPASLDQRRNNAHCAVQPIRMQEMSDRSPISLSQAPPYCAEAKQHPLSECRRVRHAANITSPDHCWNLCMSPISRSCGRAPWATASPCQSPWIGAQSPQRSYMAHMSCSCSTHSLNMGRSSGSYAMQAEARRRSFGGVPAGHCSLQFMNTACATCAAVTTTPQSPPTLLHQCVTPAEAVALDEALHTGSPPM